MDWITDKVAIGNYLEAQDLPFLTRHGFRSILSLDGTLSDRHAADFGMVEISGYRFIDGAGNDGTLFRRALDDLRRMVAESSPVFVHCHAGRSRSVAVVAGYLMQEKDIDPDAAIAQVALRRGIAVAPELRELLHDLEW